MSSTECFQRGPGTRSKVANVPHWRLPEEPAVLAIELAGALTSDFKGGAGRIEAGSEHPRASCLQPQLFLILQRTHRGQHAEMVVQRRESHACDFSEVFDPQWLMIVCRNPGNCFCRPVSLLSKRGD